MEINRNSATALPGISLDPGTVGALYFFSFSPLFPSEGHPMDNYWFHGARSGMTKGVKTTLPALAGVAIRFPI